MIRIKIADVIGVRRADITVETTALVAGLNHSGKSSLIQAIGAAALNSPLIRHASRKSDAAHLVRDGAERGVVVLADDKGNKAKITFPALEYQTEGRPSFGTALGIGAVGFMRLNAKERTAELVERIQALPGKADLAAWLTKHGVDGKAQADLLWDRLADGDWDAVHKAAHEHSLKLKGQWERAAGERWGSAKYKDWCPRGLDPDDLKDRAGYEADLKAAKAALEETLAASAVTAEKLKDMEARVATIPEILARIAVLDERQKDLEATLEAAVRARKALPEAVTLENLPTCWKCGSPYEAYQESPGVWRFKQPTATEPLSPDELKARRLAIASADGQVASARDKLGLLARERFAEDTALKQARADEQRIIDLAGAPVADEAAVSAARQAVIDAENRLEAFKKLEETRRLALLIEANAVTVAALAPDGVRKERLAASLADFNAQLAELCSVARLPHPLEVDGAATLTYGGRPWPALSESEQWRAELIVTAAFARMEGAQLILVDRLDVLHPQARGGVLALLRHLAIPAVVCMTAKDPSAVPALGRHGLGRTYWIDDGTVEPIEP